MTKLNISYKYDIVLWLSFTKTFLWYLLYEFSMKQLRERVMKLKEDQDRIYHLTRTEGMPSINWGNMMDEKLVRNMLVYPPAMVDPPSPVRVFSI